MFAVVKARRADVRAAWVVETRERRVLRSWVRAGLVRLERDLLVLSLARVCG